MNNNNIKFIKASKKDLEEAYNVCKDVVNFMQNELKIDQWSSKYPTKSTLENDINKNELYILKNEFDIIGFICINKEVYKAYDEVTWQENKDFKTIHRVAISPKYHKKGFGNILYNLAEEEIRKQNIYYIRVDTFSLNVPMNNLIKKCGYDFKGTMNLYPQKPVWNCYEKQIKIK